MNISTIKDKNSVLRIYFNYMLKNDFIETLEYMSNLISVSSEYIGYYFTEDSYGNVDCNGGVTFFVNDADINITYEEFCFLLDRVADYYINKNDCDIESIKKIHACLNKICNTGTTHTTEQ